MSDESDSPERAGSEATSAEATVPLQPEGETEFAPFDEMLDVFGEPSPGQFVRGADGGPEQIDETTESDIAPLNEDTLVCMADRRQYMLGDAVVPSGMEIKTVWSRYSTYTLREEYARLTDLEAAFGPLGDGGERRTIDNAKWVLVRPVRPQCEHYVRQILAFQYNARHSIVSRLCAARRTTEGTFMGLSDERIEACTMRSPPDPRSHELIEEFDRNKIQQGRDRVHLKMVTGEHGAGFGIFDPQESK